MNETVVPQKRESQPLFLLAALTSGGLAWFALAGFLLNFGFAQVEVSFVLVLKDVLGYTSLNTGWVFTWIDIIIVIVQGG